MRQRTNLASYGPTLTEAKNYLRVDLSDDDLLISSLISASYDQISAECNRDFSPVTYSLNIFSSSGDIFLSSQTVNTVSTGSLKQSGGAWYTYLATDYNGPVSFTCGAGENIPNNVKVAQLMLISGWYEMRTPQAIGVSTSPLAFAVDALCSPYKLINP
jgi:hypothetical protein